MTMTWVHGTTTYDKGGRFFIARNSEGFNLFRTVKPWGVGTLIGTFGSQAEAKHAAERA